MNTKKSLIAIGVAAATTVSTAYAGTLSFNNPAVVLPAISVQSHHQVWGGTLYNSFDNGTGVAIDSGGGFFNITHSKVGGSLTNINVTCSGDGTDASGNLDLEEPDTFYGQWGVFHASGAASPPGPFGPFPEGDVNMGNTGEIVDGWGSAGSFDLGGGLFVTPIFNFTPPRAQVDFFGSGCTSGGIAALVPAAEEAYSLVRSTLDAGGSYAAGALETEMTLLPADCQVTFVSPMALGQCDPTVGSDVCASNLEKAVPMPALAAAVLGLGLFGITYLTSRRRNVK